MHDTELDALLAPPALTNPASLDADLAAMLHRPRRAPRLIAAGVGVALVLGGSTAAAASMGAFDWAPWAQSVPSQLLTLPSGAQCEFRIGNVIVGDPDAAAATEQLIAETDFVAEIDMDAVLREYDVVDPDDVTYRSLFSGAAHFLLMKKLEDRGFDLDEIYFGSISGEGHCSEGAE
jgi:hypothetical protein